MTFAKRLTKGLLGVLVLLIPVVIFWQRQTIMDWWRLRGYQPPARIVELADNTTMTGGGERLFYIGHPLLEAKAAFAEHCKSTEESIVLGCYVNGSQIYIFDVTEPRLKGVVEVTAAHEMLHAAYDRLSSRDRRQVDNLTQTAFAALDNQRIKDTIEIYRQRDPASIPNELHSILGTEVRSLPGDLEA